MVRQWIAVVPATPVIIAVLTLILFWLLTRKRRWGCLSKPLVSTFGRQKMPGKHADHRHAYLRVERAVCGVAGIIVAADIRGADANNAGLGWSWTPFSRW